MEWDKGWEEVDKTPILYSGTCTLKSMKIMCRCSIHNTKVCLY